MKLDIKHIILSLLLPLVLFFQIGQSNFVHVHINANGDTIKHSHPYSSKENNDTSQSSEHQHSNDELVVLGFFDGTFHNDAEPCLLAAINPKRVVSNIYVFYKNELSEIHCSQLRQRGPPNLYLV